jgi:ribose transport system substrate-binding protein
MARSRTVFSLSLVLVIALVALVLGVVAGRATSSGKSGGGGGGGGAASGQKVDVIIRANDSAFWQTMLAGAEKAGKDFGITVGKFGPTSETNIDEQVQLVENSVSRGVNAIVISPGSNTALNSSIDSARKAGIKVITADSPITTPVDGFIGTNNSMAGALAGRRMCDLLTEKGKTSGKVFVESSVAGIQVLLDRDAGFRSGLAEKCPNINATLESYNNNDIGTAASQVNDAISANPDLVGVFADNNTSGVGAATAIQDNNAADRIPVVAFDSDPKENAALAAGTIDALIVQNPFFFGYQGVVEAAMATQGGIPPASIDPGAVVADKNNMDKPEVKALLEPPTAQAGG